MTPTKKEAEIPGEKERGRERQREREKRREESDSSFEYLIENRIGMDGRRRINGQRQGRASQSKLGVIGERVGEW